jgi:hypothetical protein
MMKHGPVDVIVMAFGEPQFDGSILAELEKKSADGTIRVLDAMVLFKDADETCWQMELSELPQEQMAALDFIEAETRGLFDGEDADIFYDGMVPGSAVLALAIEHTWAIDLVNAMVNSGFEFAINYRVPVGIVEEAFANLEA